MEIGLPKLLTELGLEEGPRLKAYFSTTDRVRIDKSERMANAVAKKRRRDKTIAMAATEESYVEMEGVTYGPGQF